MAADEVILVGTTNEVLPVDRDRRQTDRRRAARADRRGGSMRPTRRPSQAWLAERAPQRPAPAPVREVE